MVVIRKSFVLALFAVLLFSSLVSALSLDITVVDKDGTKMYNASVEILQGNTVLYQKYADLDGNANFTLAPGTYFIRPIRDGYPGHVLMYDIQKSATVQVVMLINRNTYILFGQMVDSPPSRWEGANITLLDGQGRVARNHVETVGSNGYFLIPYLFVGENYQLKVQGSGGQYLSGMLSYDQPLAYYLELHPDSQTVVNAAPLLAGPTNATLASPIIVTLRAGTKPMAGQSIQISTPSGPLTLQTDAQGSVQVNAADAGTYTFSWNDQTVSTTVAGAPKPLIPSTPSTPTTTPSSGVPASPALPSGGESTPAPSASNSSSSNWLMIGGGLLVLFVVVIGLVLIVATLLAPWLYRTLSGRRKEPAHPPLSSSLLGIGRHKGLKEAGGKPHARHHKRG